MSMSATSSSDPLSRVEPRWMEGMKGIAGTGCRCLDVDHIGVRRPVSDRSGREAGRLALEDPKGKPIETVRVLCDEIRTRVEVSVEKRGWTSR
jgi:hypothetical protein